MLHDNMDLSRLITHVQQVEDSQKKRGIHDTVRPKHYDKNGPSNRGNRNSLCICEQPRFKKGQHSLANSNFQRTTTPRGARPETKKGNGDDMQHLRKNCAKRGRAYSGECRQGTKACFGCGKNGHMVMECL